MTSELEQEVLSNTSNLKIFSGIKQVDINLLKQNPGILSLEGSYEVEETSLTAKGLRWFMPHTLHALELKDVSFCFDKPEPSGVE